MPDPIADGRLDAPRTPLSELEVSVVIPCLNEADTIVACVSKARTCLRRLGVGGEVIVADNGSTDGSRELATAAGAEVVLVAAKGYGHALIGGIEAARGRFIIMGDADDSYDFNDLEKFIRKLREGNDLVQGCRLPAGGGTVLPGAMPFLHRWWGNPMFTQLARWWFGSPVNDIYCGFRGFRTAWWHQLQQRCTGMEFATEMLIKGSLGGAKIAEVPITLHPDGRRAHAPHLKTFRDGWRTLRFFLVCSPRWLFLVPGFLLILLGAVGYVVALPRIRVFGVHLDAHTLLFSTLAILCGYQAVLFSIFSKTFAIKSGVLPPDARLEQFFKVVNLERGLAVALLAMLVGTVLLGLAINKWRLAHFGPLDYSETMRLVIPGATLFALGFQTVLASFFTSILGLDRR